MASKREECRGRTAFINRLQASFQKASCSRWRVRCRLEAHSILLLPWCWCEPLDAGDCVCSRPVGDRETVQAWDSPEKEPPSADLMSAAKQEPFRYQRRTRQQSRLWNSLVPVYQIRWGKSLKVGSISSFGRVKVWSGSTGDGLSHTHESHLQNESMQKVAFHCEG